jgi:cellulose synthase/poly-beta-1,6-N-acetylglucosamine synthase-like glycosyltransferase
MDNFLLDLSLFYINIAGEIAQRFDAIPLIMRLFPFFLLLEVPYQLLISVGIFKYYVMYTTEKHSPSPLFFPRISVILTCYSEGESVGKSIRSLIHQEYFGDIEILAVVDGSEKNAATSAAAHKYAREADTMKKRTVRVIDKKMRGGRVSSLNTGTLYSTGSIIISLDGDTSVDNDMARKIVRHFRDPLVLAVSGNIRVRNISCNGVTHLQGLEYCLGIGGGRTGLSEVGMINNISGAFGAFRRSVVEKIGGWDTGTAEDLDITIRLKEFMGRNPKLKIVFDPHATSHTDVPTRFRDLISQRFRWDGDLAFLYIKKYWRIFTPKIVGWRNFLQFTVYGLGIQITLPFLLVIFHVWLMVNFPAGHVAGILSFTYLVYTLFTAVFYIQYLLMISREKKKDILLIPWILVYPAYAFILRIMMTLFILRELLFEAHRYSTMAPQWVLEKGKF